MAIINCVHACVYVCALSCFLATSWKRGENNWPASVYWPKFSISIYFYRTQIRCFISTFVQIISFDYSCNVVISLLHSLKVIKVFVSIRVVFPSTSLCRWVSCVHLWAPPLRHSQSYYTCLLFQILPNPPLKCWWKGLILCREKAEGLWDFRDRRAEGACAKGVREKGGGALNTHYWAFPYSWSGAEWAHASNSSPLPFQKCRTLTRSYLDVWNIEWNWSIYS